MSNWTNLYISGNIESTNKADHILEMPRLGGNLWLLTRFLILNLCLQINALDVIYDQRRPSICLTTVMFHGTPCICHIINQIKVFGLYRCIAIFALRLIWNHPYSPFYRKYLELVFFYLYKYWAWYFAYKKYTPVWIY